VATLADFTALVAQLPDATSADHGRHVSYGVTGRTFAYLWPATDTVGLKQLLPDQLDLVAERPEVFEVQFTAGAYGWVVVHVEGVDRTELAELAFEAWRLAAPAELVEARADRLPT